MAASWSGPGRVSTTGTVEHPVSRVPSVRSSGNPGDGIGAEASSSVISIRPRPSQAKTASRKLPAATIRWLVIPPPGAELYSDTTVNPSGSSAAASVIGGRIGSDAGSGIGDWVGVGIGVGVADDGG